MLNNSLTNENNESFNFGVKDGVRGFFTNPSRADDSFIPFKRDLQWYEVKNKNGVVNTIDVGYRPTFIIAIRHNAATGGALSLYKDEQILHCSLPGTTINNTVTLTVEDTGFTYKQTFTGNTTYPLEYAVF